MLRWTDNNPDNRKMKKAQAIALFNAAIRKDLPSTKAYLNLGIMLQGLSLYQESAEAFRRAIQKDLENPAAYGWLATVLSSLGNNDEAIEVLRDSLKALPNNAETNCGIGEILESEGNRADALSAYEKAIHIDPGHIESNNGCAKLELIKGNPQRTEAICDNSLKSRKYNTRTLALKIAALKESGKDKEASFLEDHERFLRFTTLEGPKEFDNLASFNAALKENIKSNVDLKAASKYKATQKGLQTVNLYEFHGNGPFEPFVRILRNAIESYILDFPVESDHPFIMSQPQQAKILGWGVVLLKGGHQAPHIHPSAWLSGVYYIDVFESVKKDKSNPAGWIEFGGTEAAYNGKARSETKLFQPEDGMLALFPSYFVHRTIPTMSDKERVCFAFDVVPVK
jgi:Tfp pilus assembly protein PilF